ncbi:MAG: aldehyde dehydrogenase family protein, partial [Natronospirillum sp.]
MSQTILTSWVGGQPVHNANGETFAVVNPGTGQEIYRVEQADTAVMKAAVAAAQQGFAVWSALTAMERSRILRRAADLLREDNDRLAEIEVLDTGKPWQEACAVDVQTGADAIEFFACEAPGMEGNTQPVGNDFYYTRHEPLGICAGIGAWNYPLQIACWKAAPALACGNAMI